MDAQRFGRALGVGTRAAAKALLQAADAAAAPNPRTAGDAEAPAETTVSNPTGVAPAVGRRAMPSAVALKRGTKALGGSLLAPAVRAGNVLWLEVTGSFFGLFALTAAADLWHLRAAMREGGEVRRHALLALAMFLVFSWFTVSSFVKAHRRARRS